MKFSHPTDRLQTPYDAQSLHQHGQLEATADKAYWTPHGGKVTWTGLTLQDIDLYAGLAICSGGEDL